MKWFKHETSAHTNMKLQSVINEFQAEGYGYFWALVEIVGQTDDYCLVKDKEWQIYLKKILGIDLDKQKLMLAHFANKNLIDKQALRRGDLFIPKLAERSDEYSNKLRRKSGHDPEKVALDKIRIEEDKNRIEQIHIAYRDKIQPKSKLLDKAKDKISKRLKLFSVEDMIKAIDNFSQDSWWMENNGDRGIAWFFHSDERIEQFMNLKPRKKTENKQAFKA